MNGTSSKKRKINKNKVKKRGTFAARKKSKIKKLKMKKQRKVNEKLGRNKTKDHDELYKQVEEKYGPTKICNFGLKRGSKTGVKHIHTNTGNECPEELPIRDFELHSKGGVQGFCRNCSKRRRKARIQHSRKQNLTGGYILYIKKHGTTKQCSRCKEEKDAHSFNLSPSMECGLHNMCKSCCSIYGESVGDRWIRYLPDGNFKYKKTEQHQHDDHILPLAVGGSNEEANHQLIASKENLEKSATIPYENVKDIPDNQLCERWRPILRDCKENGHSVKEFECKVREAIYEEQTKRYNMSEEEHLQYLKDYNKKNNTRKGIERAHKKFREFYKARYSTK